MIPAQLSQYISSSGPTLLYEAEARPRGLGSACVGTAATTRAASGADGVGAGSGIGAGGIGVGSGSGADGTVTALPLQAPVSQKSSRLFPFFSY